jgi:hypothetical protein
VVRSRGVRFSNGPFLDIHSRESGQGAVALLRGGLAEAEGLSAREGWRAIVHRRSEAPADARPPWSILAFRRGQGALSHLAVIDYEADPRGYAVSEYTGPLLALNSGPRTGPRLARVEIGPMADLRPLRCPEIVGGQAEGVTRIEISGVAAESFCIGPVVVAFLP